MTRRQNLIIFALALAFNLLAASFQSTPGYMDADYHLYMGRRLAEGHGFSEEILWNYLDEPSALPHPSHSYWPPLPSLLAWAGVTLFPSLSLFQAGRLFFILISALIPILTGMLAFRLSRDRFTAVFASLIALFATFYLPYNLTTDSFAPTMLLGALFFLTLMKIAAGEGGLLQYIFLGAVAGLLHLTRAEGLLWLPLAFLAAFLIARKDQGSQPTTARAMGALLLTYLLIIAPWMIRNLSAFGGSSAPGALRALWLTHYDDLFLFPASALNPQTWLDSGWPNILQSHVWALGQNALTGIAVQGAIVLAPLILIVLWQLRRKIAVRITLLAWILLFLSMSVFFPFPGVRGGFFHAGAALQPMLWSLGAVGFGHVLAWGVHKRGWQLAQARAALASGLLLIVLGLSATIFARRVIGDDAGGLVWNANAAHYATLSERLDDLGIAKGATVLVNNPPGFALASGMKAIVIPNGPLPATLQVAQAFGARYLLLEANHPRELDALHANPTSSSPGLRYLLTMDGTHVFAIEGGGADAP